MKRLVVFLIGPALVLAVGCQRRVDVTTDTTAVTGVLENYIASVEKEDVDLYGKVMAQDAGMVNYGTAGAPIVGWDALKKVIEDQNAALSQTIITASDVSVKISPA